MSVRVRYKIEVAVSSTSAEERDLGNARWEVVTDVQGEKGGGKFTLAAGSTNVSIALGNVSTARLLVIRTTSKDPNQDPVDITIRRNLVGNEAIVIRPLSDAKEGHYVCSTDSMTALFATNAGATDMELTIFVVGD
jgi:hypothetical protein